ncbi:hypothetical protein NDI76_12705 [Halogeometricum sp. S1BR25-6]|uniref:DUF8060 domain-containing protein n=2 Tax=Halogeometricum salsisoli TaxID=2950536 RepID=A0ABU2GHP3_9EURY|nr:hypothetical protein [Halogeometricum sp. S1BR25-6]MDS0299603.1 hypothetical protein [Halogeometricum sp. S1BR25-6]
MTDRAGADRERNDAADADGDTTMPTDSTTETGAPTREPSDDEGSAVDRLRTTLNYAVLGGLLLLAAISAVQLYLAVGRTISTFVVYEYRAPLMVAFNLAVLLLAALGISLQLRRLSGSEEE